MKKFTTMCGILSVCLGMQGALFAADPAKQESGQNVETEATPNSPRGDETPQDTVDVPESSPQPESLRSLGTLTWHTNYVSAYQQARREQKMLFLFFRDARDPRVADAYERNVLSNPENQTPLKNVVRAILPLDVPQPVVVKPVSASPNADSPAADAATQPAETSPPAPRRLLSHRSFAYLYGRMGIAMIDLQDSKSPHYGKVVSAHPFTPGQHYTTSGTQTVLGLPAGSVTQRALIYAVRMHPSQPASAFCTAHPYLLEQSRRSSQLMAQSESVGHHDWGTRSAEITSATGRSPMEVAACGFGSSALIDAAFECVANWQGSPTHWGMMTAPATLFGYDMVQGASGNWYGTGIFAP